MEQWYNLLVNVGLPTFLLGVFLYWIWRAGRWLGSIFVVPAVERVLKLLDAVIVSIVQQGKAMETISGAMERMCVQLVDRASGKPAAAREPDPTR